ncbi:MAG: chitobiase/beta-hexosaminidase C-terminal domain-containing protein, partial [Flavobacteriaceae bacterium]|nr:chitobiase/beta-hexosaminidase C-terminal domain-containing protein [Flavobacteriaceae bacterium]
ELNQFWFKHTDLVKGGKLVLEMGSEPNKQWAINSEHPQVMDIEPIAVTPYITDTERVFNEDREVKLACDTKDSEIYYTLDGSEPTKKSMLYKKPFTVNKTTTIKMIAYKGIQESLPSTAEIKKIGEIEKVYLSQVSPGLSYKYAHGIFRVVNDMLNATPVKTGIHSQFNHDLREKEQFFSFDFEGYINIPKDGEYTLYLATNDGGRLYIDDILLLNNDGLHPVIEINKSIRLKAGLHPISVKYFQEGGSNGLKVSWEGPGIEKEEIPAKVLFHKKK